MSGTLYLVATPIGNLGDLSPRAADILERADFIAAEDTRVTMKLLSHLGLKKPMVSYHEHNKAAAGPAVLAPARTWSACAPKTAWPSSPSPGAAPSSPPWPSAACPQGGSSSRGSCP